MRGTIYEGSEPCGGCGTILTPIEAMWTDLCPDCTQRQVRALIENLMVGDPADG